ncbi:MAG: hypothetical protein ABJO01_04410 [Parasphingorhabdus sp.]|uniref:hypothetical protein n=1 Tax=Parasphingorhabdus sp. TaxID=2709688 RepID=UPI0032986040
MKNRFLKKCAGLILFFAIAIWISPVQAQISAFLPMKERVAAGEPSAVDGTYWISSINKRITIANGRAYAVDPWVHALVLQVKPNMVVMRNFRQAAPDRFIADDLPLMGQATFVRQADGVLDVKVAGALGPVRYKLIPVDYIDNPVIDDLPADDIPIAPEPDREYHLYVNVISCDGAALLRKRYRGFFSLSVTDAEGNEIRSGSRSFDVRCTRKGPRRQTLNHDANGKGSLSIVVPPGQDGFSDFVINTTLNDLLGPLDLKNDKSSLLLKAKNLRRNLNPGESIDNVERIASGKARLLYRVQLRRVR